MPNNFDRRRQPKVQELVKRVRGVKTTPLVGEMDLEEIVKGTDVLPELRFPIDSAGDLIDQLGGGDQPMEVVGVKVDPVRMMKYVPAYYFPISSMTNFVEKMAELIRQNRPKVDVRRELASVKASLKRQSPKFGYPIESADVLLRMLGKRGGVRFKGAMITADEARRHLPPEIFPIESERDFDHKIGRLMVSRPLIVRD